MIPRYKVTGPTRYRGHWPGSTFVAILPPDVERRAIERRSIKLIRRERRGLKPGSYTLPRGWLPAESPEAAEAAFSLDRKEH